jgi:hypothetical protein
MISNSAVKPQSLPIMCRLLLLAITSAVFALPSLCSAQDQEQQPNEQQPNIDSAIEIARANMRVDRVNIITAGMNFNDKEGAAFWPIYRQYEHERSTLDDSRVAVIKEYTQKYPDLSDAEAKAMAERMFEYDSRLAALKKTYYKKFNKVLPALTVTKFFQLERRLDLLMDMNVEASLPPLTQAQYTGKTAVAPEN